MASDARVKAVVLSPLRVSKESTSERTLVPSTVAPLTAIVAIPVKLVNPPAPIAVKRSSRSSMVLAAKASKLTKLTPSDVAALTEFNCSAVDDVLSASLIVIVKLLVSPVSGSRVARVAIVSVGVIVAVTTPDVVSVRELAVLTDIVSDEFTVMS